LRKAATHRLLRRGKWTLASIKVLARIGPSVWIKISTISFGRTT
jgi:hypothetical protein